MIPDTQGAGSGGAVVTDDDALAEKLRSEIEHWPMQPVKELMSKVKSAAITDIITSQLFFRTIVFRFFRWAFVNRIDAINNKLKIDTDPNLVKEIPSGYKRRVSPLQARLVRDQLDAVDGHYEARREAARRYYEGLADIPGLICAPMLEDRSHIYWYYPIQFADRNSLASAIMNMGRDITPSYHRNCAGLPCFAEYSRECPNAQATADSVIYLPTYPGYGLVEVDANIKAVRSYFGL